MVDTPSRAATTSAQVSREPGGWSPERELSGMESRFRLWPKSTATAWKPTGREGDVLEPGCGRHRPATVRFDSSAIGQLRLSDTSNGEHVRTSTSPRQRWTGPDRRVRDGVLGGRPEDHPPSSWPIFVRGGGERMQRRRSGGRGMAALVLAYGNPGIDTSSGATGGRRLRRGVHVSSRDRPRARDLTRRGVLRPPARRGRMPDSL